MIDYFYILFFANFFQPLNKFSMHRLQFHSKFQAIVWELWPIAAALHHHFLKNMKWPKLRGENLCWLGMEKRAVSVFRFNELLQMKIVTFPLQFALIFKWWRSYLNDLSCVRKFMWTHNMFVVSKCWQAKFLLENSCFKGITHSFMFLMRLYPILEFYWTRFAIDRKNATNKQSLH